MNYFCNVYVGKFLIKLYVDFNKYSFSWAMENDSFVTLLIFVTIEQEKESIENT